MGGVVDRCISFWHVINHTHKVANNWRSHHPCEWCNSNHDPYLNRRSTFSPSLQVEIVSSILILVEHSHLLAKQTISLFPQVFKGWKKQICPLELHRVCMTCQVMHTLWKCGPTLEIGGGGVLKPSPPCFLCQCIKDLNQLGPQCTRLVLANSSL